MYNTIVSLEPDILIVDLLWFPLYYMVEKFPWKTIFLWAPIDKSYFSWPSEGTTLHYDPDKYDRIVAIAPFRGKGPELEVNPLILRNRDEILNRTEALEKLGLKNSDKNCLLAYNGHPKDFERVKEMYSFKEKEYTMVYTTNYKGGIFPVVDYFNAFDLVICQTGYSSFWETRYFNKEAIWVPTKTSFFDGERLAREYSDYTFEKNGADQLVDILIDIL